MIGEWLRVARARFRGEGKPTTVRAAFWSVSGMAGYQVTLGLRTLLFATLIGPADYGVWSLALAYISVAEAFLRAAMPTSVACARPAHLERFLATANSINLILVVIGSTGILGAGLLMSLAPSLSRLAPLLVSAALMPTVGNLTNVAEGYLRRELRFRVIAMARVAGGTASLLVGAALALRQYGVWAPLAAHYVERTIALAVFVVHAPWIFRRFRLSSEDAAHLLRNLKATVLADVLQACAFALEATAIHFFLGPIILAGYTLAMRIAKLVFDVVGVSSSALLQGVYSSAPSACCRAAYARASLQRLGLVAAGSCLATSAGFCLISPFLAAGDWSSLARVGVWVTSPIAMQVTALPLYQYTLVEGMIATFLISRCLAAVTRLLGVLGALAISPTTDAAGAAVALSSPVALVFLLVVTRHSLGQPTGAGLRFAFGAWALSLSLALTMSAAGS